MNDRFSLAGKTVFITGASSGFGAHFARVCAEAGASAIAIAARRVDRLTALATELECSGAHVAPIAMDITDPAAPEAALADIANRLGEVDVLVNNAGVADPKSFLEADDASIEGIMETNLMGLWRLSRAWARRLVAAHRPGSMVNIASILGLGVSRNQAAYATSKAGVMQLTKSMALELWDHGIRCNAIAPGYFETEINTDFFHSDAGKRYVGRMPAKRLGQLHELDGALLLLASDAGSFITGATIPVDGAHSIKLV